MKGLSALLWEPHVTDRCRLRRILSGEGWTVQEAGVREDLAGYLEQSCWALVFCCVAGGGGPEMIGQLRRKLGAATPIIATGPADGSWPAFELLLAGATAYCAKPFRVTEIRQQLRALQQHQKTLTAETFKPNGMIVPGPAAGSGNLSLIGHAAPFAAIIQELAHALAGDSQPANCRRMPPPAYFLSGETGTGKELFAQLIHQRSRFQQGPFIAVNCATLPAELVAAELFGHETGAFTGAGKARPGLWEQADGGTLLLDEITEAPRSLWPKLLRVLQDGQVKRLGGASGRATQVQVIAASNRDLAQEIAAGRFRRDLYQRFLHRLHLPPLRERQADIPLLAKHFAQRYAPHQPVQFSQEALAWLQEQPWPGNVRELEHLMRSVVTHTADGRITASTLRRRLAAAGAKTVNAPIVANSGDLKGEISLAEQVQEFKRRTVTEALIRYRGNISRAAAALGLTRPTLYKILQEKPHEM